jgi:peroxiredoxin
MRRVLMVALALGVAATVVVAVLYGLAPPATRVKVGTRAPDLNLPQITGGPPRSLPGLGRAPVMLVIFDLRLPHASYVLGDLERMNRRYVARGLRVVAVSLDADAGPVRATAAEANVTFPILHDPGGVALRDTYGVPSGFMAYLISPTGVLEQVYRGPLDWRSIEVRERLEAHLAPPPPGW